MTYEVDPSNIIPIPSAVPSPTPMQPQPPEVQIIGIRVPVDGGVEHITHFVWTIPDMSPNISLTFVCTRSQMVEFLDNGSRAFVLVVNGAEVDAVPYHATQAGREAWVETAPDASEQDNLLALPRS